MIEDLDGATVEPTRRGHVIVLSTATAAVALAILVALVVPPSGGVVVQPPSASASASGAPTMTIVSGDAGFVAGSGRVTLDQLRAQFVRPDMCGTSPPFAWGSPRVVDGMSYAVEGRTGRVLLPPGSAAVSRSGWLTVRIYDQSGEHLLYSCATPDALAPRVDLSNIAR